MTPTAAPAPPAASPAPFWSEPPERLLAALGSRASGLDDAEATAHRAGAGKPLAPVRAQALSLLLAQFASPIVLVLLGAAVLSGALGASSDAAIIFGIVVASAVLSFWQEHSAARAVEGLLAAVHVRVSVRRGGHAREVPLEQVAPGDVVELEAGDLVPGDGVLLEARDLFVDEASLTGESYPAEKRLGPSPPEAPLPKRLNAVWMGTHVVSGSAAALVLRTGADTEFGRVAGRLALRPPLTEFERGVRRFGALLVEVTLFLVLAIFAVNVAFARPVLESLLFSVAVAVGLTPQLLPAVITVNLARGARRMAAQRVIVKRLAAIEDFGGMDVLCTDKTGTLTEGKVVLHDAVDLHGQPSARVRLLATVNAAHETGFRNPIDEALRAGRTAEVDRFRKLDEIPYDFVRKRLTVLVDDGGSALAISKGAVAQILDACARADADGGGSVPVAEARAGILARCQALATEGYRTLGVAVRPLGAARGLDKRDESDMTFVGLLVFDDPPKPGADEVIARLGALGVRLKLLTGDGAAVAASLARRLGLPADPVVTGSELNHIGAQALRVLVQRAHVFAELEPHQKERLVVTLRQAGHVVGFLGDGINDASAIHAADVGISVDSAADVAKDAADIVLLDKDLGVLADGVVSGRAAFANTLKYLFMATSANFGNMFSMAAASLFLPFLPLLPKQVLLTNFLTDLPEMTIASDDVDAEAVAHPRRWDIALLRRFMIVFGLLSSCFDFVTFAVLRLGLHAGEVELRTGWFVESVCSAALIVLVIRTSGPTLRSRPARPLLLATLGVVAATVLLPFLPMRTWLGFGPLPGRFYAALAGILVAYLLSAEVAKRRFWRARLRDAKAGERAQPMPA